MTRFCSPRIISILSIAILGLLASCAELTTSKSAPTLAPVATNVPSPSQTLQPEVSPEPTPQTSDSPAPVASKTPEIVSSAPVSNSPTEFNFFLRQDLEEGLRQSGEARVKQQEPRIVRLMRHPCGVSAIAKVTVMPSFNRETLVPEKVVEVDAENNTLRRWSKPVDSKLLAIAGERILVETDPNQRCWIDLDGNFQLQMEPISFSQPVSEKYNKHPEFAATGVFSQQFRDLNSSSDRHLLSDAPCT